MDPKSRIRPTARSSASRRGEHSDARTVNPTPTHILYHPSTNLSMNLLNRADFLPAFRARLDEEPEVVVAEFEAFRKGRTSSLYAL